MIRITTAEDTILLKMAFHRQKDIQDIKGILHVQKWHLDMTYFRKWGVEVLEATAIQELDDLIATCGAGRPAAGT